MLALDLFFLATSTLFTCLTLDKHGAWNLRGTVPSCSAAVIELNILD